MIRVMFAVVPMIASAGLFLHGLRLVPIPVASDPPRPGFRINLVHAGPEALGLLPGIGSIMAARIIDWRRQGHRIEDADQLRAIHGIGPRTIENIRPWVTP